MGDLRHRHAGPDQPRLRLLAGAEEVVPDHRRLGRGDEPGLRRERQVPLLPLLDRHRHEQARVQPVGRRQPRAALVARSGRAQQETAEPVPARERRGEGAKATGRRRRAAMVPRRTEMRHSRSTSTASTSASSRSRLPTGNYARPERRRGRQVFYLVRSEQGGGGGGRGGRGGGFGGRPSTATTSIDVAIPPSRPAWPLTSLTPDGRKMLYSTGGSWFITSTAGAGGAAPAPTGGGGFGGGRGQRGQAAAPRRAPAAMAAQPRYDRSHASIPAPSGSRSSTRPGASTATSSTTPTCTAPTGRR